MRIVGVTDSLCHVGGAELSTRTIVAGLASHPEVDSVTVVGATHPDYDRLDFGDADVVPVRLPETVKSAPDLVGDVVVERALANRVEEVVDDERAHVVHAHHRRSGLAVSRRDFGVPTVSTVRDFWPICPISVYDLGGEMCTGCRGNLDACVANQGWTGAAAVGAKPYLLTKRRHQCGRLDDVDCGVFIADHLRSTVDEATALPDRTEVIYNPVEIDASGGPNEESRDEPPTFVTASSLTHEKGLDTAIRAMGRIAENHPDARLVVFGDGPLEEELHALAERVCPPGTVTFRGRVPPETVYDAIAGATATVFPSRWAEPFGRVTVESMTLGTPVVGSDVGGIGELVEDGSNGLLFPVDDDAVLAECLRELCEDASLRTLLADGGRRTAERFTPQRIVAEHLDLYAELVQS